MAPTALVLLGDAIELRERPVGAALEQARPVLESIAAAIGDIEVILVPGNHDSRLAEPLLDRTLARGRAAHPRRHGRARPRPDRRGRRRPLPRPPADRLPGDLAPRGRLRHPRPLPRRPPAPAAGRVHRRGRGQPAGGRAPGSGRPAGLRAHPPPHIRTGLRRRPVAAPPPARAGARPLRSGLGTARRRPPRAQPRPPVESPRRPRRLPRRDRRRQPPAARRLRSRHQRRGDLPQRGRGGHRDWRAGSASTAAT